MDEFDILMGEQLKRAAGNIQLLLVKCQRLFLSGTPDSEVALEANRLLVEIRSYKNALGVWLETNHGHAKWQQCADVEKELEVLLAKYQPVIDELLSI